MAGDYPDIPFVAAAGDGGVRGSTQMVVIHATDNTAGAEAEASYATRRLDQVSAHFYSDEVRVVQGVPLGRVAYGCYPIGNGRSVQFELCGLSNHLTDATLRRAAPIVRRVCDRYGLPIRHVGPAELRAGVRGICGHGDVTLAWGQGDHTDPGATFPWATFIGYVTTTQEAKMPKLARIDDGPFGPGAINKRDGVTRARIGTMDEVSAWTQFWGVPASGYPVISWANADWLLGRDVSTLSGQPGPAGPAGPAILVPHTHTNAATGPATASGGNASGGVAQVRADA
jgi:hypothetical protein